MPSAVRSRLTYANVVATLALVFAMSGGALAATHYLITSKKQISPKVLKELKGGAGAAGAAGTAGAAGAPGKEGAAGKDGAAGSSGTNGESVSVASVELGEEACGGVGGAKFSVGGKSTTACNGKGGKEGKEGKAGENVTNTANPANCKEGGAEFKVGSGTPTYACNGSPWTAGGTLPSGATETGTWGFTTNTLGVRVQRVPISFPIPLAKPITKSNIEVVKAGATGTGGCEGGTVAAPTAKPGNLCIYITELEANEHFAFIDPGSSNAEAGITGLVLGIEPTNKEPGEEGGQGLGTWAVTGE
jgi:hypothetical protein